MELHSMFLPVLFPAMRPPYPLSYLHICLSQVLQDRQGRY